MLVRYLILSVMAGAALGASAIQTPNRPQIPKPRSILSSPPFSSNKGLKTQTIAASASDSSTIGLVNTEDDWYLANITLGGSEFIVQLDTGSTDLVLFPDRPINTTSVIMGSDINATYGTGWFHGPIAAAKLEFGGYTVESQTFLNGTSVSNWDKAVTLRLGVRGIMGVALASSHSWIRTELDKLYSSNQADEMGRNVLGNIFHQDADLGNFTVVLLGRTDDGEGTGEGYLGIGEYPEGIDERFANISSVDTFSPRAWTVPVDAIAVNGQTVALQSAIQDAPAGKAIALLDTGTSVGLVPKDVLDAMYGGIPGAWWSNDYAAWVVPCLTDAPNITVTIGGQAYYIHPLDLTNIRRVQKYTVCTSSFGILDLKQTAFDIILGDSFLRNVFTTFYYGTFDAAGDVNLKSPSVKLLSSSDGVDADYDDFLSRRRQNLASLPPEATKTQIEDVLSQAQSQSACSNDASVSELIYKFNTFAIIVVGLLGAICILLLCLLGLSVMVCIRRGRTVGTGRTAVDPSYVPVPLRFKEPESQYKDEEDVHYH